MERIRKAQERPELRVEGSAGVSMFLGTIMLVCAGSLAFGNEGQDSFANTELKIASVETSKDESLDVRIDIFDVGKLLKSKGDRVEVSDEIRKAEARYMAVQLRDALSQSGYWGAVRVSPIDSQGDEVRVVGRALVFDGEESKLEIEVVDAAGANWFGRPKTYRSIVSLEASEESEKRNADSARGIYNRIANDMALYRESMSSEGANKIRRVAEMRFARGIAPDDFSVFIREDEKLGTYSLNSLPPNAEKSLERIRKIREWDYTLIDRIDALYSIFSYEMNASSMYAGWRMAQLDALVLRRDSKGKKAIIEESDESGGAAIEALEASFSAKVETMRFEIEGKEIVLSGSSEIKWMQWQGALNNAFEAKSELKREEITVDAVSLGLN